MTKSYFHYSWLSENHIKCLIINVEVLVYLESFAFFNSFLEYLLRKSSSMKKFRTKFLWSISEPYLLYLQSDCNSSLCKEMGLSDYGVHVVGASTSWLQEMVKYQAILRYNGRTPLKPKCVFNKLTKFPYMHHKLLYPQEGLLDPDKMF